MRDYTKISVACLAVAAGWVSPAHAETNAAVQAELAAMRAQMQAMAQRIDSLEGQLQQAKADAAQASQSAAAASQSAAAATQTAAAAQTAAAKASATQVAWKGAPEFKAEGGWSFKPRGRLQVDLGSVNAPKNLSGGANDHLGTSAELRRAYLGVDGTIPGGFGYRAEIDVASSNVVITDLFMTYKVNPKLTLTLGNHKPFWGMEELTSDNFTSDQERASFAQAFNFERRLGISAQYMGESLILQGGVFTDDVNTLNTDNDKNWSVDGRVVFMPKLAGGMLHLGASAHYTEFGGLNTTTRYRTRPFVHTTDVRLVDTGTFTASGERALGLELGYINGPFHFASEAYGQKAIRTGFANPTFWGGYAEVGYVLTGEATPYKNGTFDRLKPAKGLDKGGSGAFQINARYDRIDLTDSGVNGGLQQTGAISLIWAPTEFTRFIVDYGHLWLKDAPVKAAGDGTYQVDAMGMRAQFDF